MAAKKAATKKEAAPKKAAQKKPSFATQYDERIKLADPLRGDKDPDFVAWCKENMSPEDFEAKYNGRTIPNN